MWCAGRASSSWCCLSPVPIWPAQAGAVYLRCRSPRGHIYIKPDAGRLDSLQHGKTSAQPDVRQCNTAVNLLSATDLRGRWWSWLL